ncbi:MAG: tail fiber protein [Acidobacteria bacterium]|nr:tail fiber protein [Acidobacteriota bacterium]
MSDECEKLLADGVFDHHFSKASVEKDLDYKQYIESEQFKEDFQKGKFNLGLDVIVDAVPIGLKFGAEEAEINNFIEKVKQSTGFSMTTRFYQVYQYSVTNEPLLKAYTECREKNKKFGFDISSDIADTSITFKVKYSNFGGLQDPEFNEVFITPEAKLQSATIKKGEKLENNSEEVFTFDLAKETKEVIFTIDTDLTAQSLKVTRTRKGESLGVPIGTVIASFLTWSEFEKATENNKDSGGVWKSEFSYWAPCDGRAVSNSEFSSITSSPNVPDLRGVFQRGLNIFDVEGELGGKISAVQALNRDPQPGRVRGTFQNDAFKIHAHSYDDWGTPYLSDDGGSSRPNECDGKIKKVTDHTGESPDETRPKNVALYYYIRIN